jgi:RNA polymerase sigma factor (TIGR02999 family)
MVTQLLERASAGQGSATEDLLPLVYDELRRIAASQLANERAGNTLQPTALVHEAYIRLVGDGEVSWNSRGHFFSAAAQAMRRILVDRARARGSQKRGGGRAREALSDSALTAEPLDDTMIAIDDLLKKLDAYDRTKGQIVMLRYFAGLSIEQTASAMGLSEHKVKTEWAFARAWMHAELQKDEGLSEGAA